MRRGKDYAKVCREFTGGGLKMDNRIEIRSNILGDIAKIRKGVVFKEPATVIDELFQNCQRAHATKIEVTIDGDHLRIVDDGVGCIDPQAVFEKNTSAWGNEDEAFGEGFFSVFLLADMLHVRSHNWKLSIDVLDMFETGDLSINVEEAPTIAGFEVDIIGEAVRREYYQLRNEAIMLGQIMPLEVSVNGSTLHRRELLSLDTSNPTYKFNNDRFEAVLTPGGGFGLLEMFYENRPVREDYMMGVNGRVHIKKGMITLKAPDRKEYIYDEKRTMLREDLHLCVTEMYRKFITEATDDELDGYANQIDEYLNVDDYLDYLPVSDDLLNLGQDNEDETEDSEDSVKETSKEVQEVKQLIRKLSNIEFKEGIDYDDMPKEPMRSRRAKGNLRELIAKSKKVSWVKSSEVDKLRSKIADAEYYGFVVLVSKNKLYENAFQSLGIPNVENLDECIEREVIKSNIGPQSKKEMRFTSLMKIVEKHYELDEDSIQLADLEMQITHNKTGEVINKGGKVHGLCDRKEGKIYINRKLVKFPEYRAQAPDYPNITAHDYRVLMRVQNTLAHELSHLLLMTEDNTLEHAQGISKISTELAELF